MVAAFSARLLAEAAARDGFDVVALDVFGDVDTRRAAMRWLPIAAAGSLQLDSGRLLDALRDLTRPGGDEVIGWIPGSGFEGRPELLAAGAELLPLIGTAAADVRRVRNPAQLFDALAAGGVDHPPIRLLAPADPDGWLSKDAAACGGWHIVPAACAPELGSAGRSRYFQRVASGIPMSATFIANGRDAVVLGCNELIVRPFGPHPYVYCGCVGPVVVSASVARQIGAAVRLLSAAFGLRGWCSLDFLRDGDDIAVLEVNPRPPATMALYGPRGLIDAQLRACLHAELPSCGTPESRCGGGGVADGGIAGSRMAGSCVTGSRIVFARHALQVDADTAQRLADSAHTHDLPAAGGRVAAGDPLCSVTARGPGAEQVKALLSARHDALLAGLDTLNVGDMS